jgi:hypothetical protein
VIREEDSRQIDKALELIDQGKVHASFQALSFKCKHKSVRLAIRYAEFRARLMLLQDTYIRRNDQKKAMHYYECSQSMQQYMNELNDKGGEV